MTKTALELTPQEWQAYQPARAIEHRRRKEKAQIDKRKQRAWELTHRAAHLLRQEFGAGRVVLFGSLAHSAWFTHWSDIDLAAWDIPPDRVYAAVAAVTGLSADFKIDLVDPETCRPSLRTVIEQDGVEL